MNEITPNHENGIDERTVQRDEAVKDLLSNRRFLAWILKGTQKEYADLPIDDIEGLIEPGDDAGHARIVGINTEDVKGGTVRYDMLFKANDPWDKRKLNLLVNVEAQARSNAGYRIEDRAEYYLARMIAMQKNWLFENDRYDLTSVRSIWLCMNCKRSEQNTIVQSNTVWKNVLGRSRLTGYRNYAGMTIIRIGDPAETDINGLMHLADTAFSGRMSLEERSDVLRKVYKVIISDKTCEGLSMLEDYELGQREMLIEEGEEKGMKKGIRIANRDTVNGAVKSAVRLITEKNMTLDEVMEIIYIPKGKEKTVRSGIVRKLNALDIPVQ